MNKNLKLIIAGVTVVSLLGISLYTVKSLNNSNDFTDVKVSNVENVTNASSTSDSSDVVDSDNAASITLNKDSISVDGKGATVDGTKVTITAAGTYTLTGELEDGQIIVNAGDNDKVKLILNGVNIKCSNSAPIYVINADKTVISLAEGSDNTIEDGSEYVFEGSDSNEPNAAIYSKDDLTINGTGALLVNANYNNGISSNDDLKINGGDIIVVSTNHGIKGKDSVTIKDGNIEVNAGGDGIKTDNAEEDDKGNISIEGGTLNITAVQDGIQADRNINILSGDITISSGGGSVNSSTKNKDNGWGNWGREQTTTGETDTTSAKGIKAGVNITIDNGNLNIDSSDDSIHTNDSVAINGGTINIASGDDGIHSDTSMEINGGTIDITKSYEGVESSEITINNGEIHVVASDDGVNVGGGNDGSSTNGRPGENMFSSSSDCMLNINGGYIYVDASGDGLDSNGSITMTGGTAIVNGPTDNGNGALDYDGNFTMDGGLLIAAGSSGMLQTPGTSSSQYTISTTLSSQEAGTLFNITSSDGKEIITFAPSKTYQSVVVCSPDIEKEETYSINIGGTSSGSEKDGLYSDGEYSGGTENSTCTTSSIVTSVGSQGGMMQGGGGNVGRPNGRR